MEHRPPALGAQSPSHWTTREVLTFLILIPPFSSFCCLLLINWRFPCGSVVKYPPAKAGDAGSTPGLGRSLEEGMVTHSSVLAWRIPWTEEPGGLQSTGSLRVEHDSGSLACTLHRVLAQASLTDYHTPRDLTNPSHTSEGRAHPKSGLKMRDDDSNLTGWL